MLGIVNDNRWFDNLIPDIQAILLKVSLELRNLLDEDYYAAMASSVIYDKYKLGSSVSLGFKFSF